jgi:hypothetical protein
MKQFAFTGRRGLSALCTLILATQVAGCGGSDSGGSSTPTPPPSGNNPPPSQPPPPPPEPQPQPQPEPEPQPQPQPPPPETATIAGVAAVGAPLSGSVTVKDSLGAIRTVPIGANGSYSVDVTGMTAPFVFRAQGRANGNEYIVHSAAAAADVNGTINITQLTDLVVSNIAGELARAYFDDGQFSSLTQTALDAEVAILKEKLLPVLQALGVDDSVDLLRTQFTPLASQLDAALDILRVSFDSTVNVATITNIVTQQQIQDDLAVAAAGEASPAQLNDISAVSEGVNDVALIKDTFEEFSALFADSLPAAGVIESKFSSTFLHDDQSGADLAAELSADGSLVGASFTEVDIKNIDYTDPSNVIATVDFSSVDGEGILERDVDFTLLKGEDGQWRWHGNQRAFDIDADVQMERVVGTHECTTTGIWFWIEDYDDANNGGEIDHFVITGPGLPPGGAVYTPPPSGGPWPLQGTGSAQFVMGRSGSSCESTPGFLESVIAGIPDNATYVFTAYSSSDNTTQVNLPGTADGAYRMSTKKRPLTLAETLASTSFPTITSPASADAFAAYAGGDLAIAASGIAFYADIWFNANTVNGEFQQIDAFLAPDENGNVSTTLSLNPPASGDRYTWRGLSVSSTDADDRDYVTTYFIHTQ